MKPGSKLWQYLKESGVLEFGGDEDIEKVRLEFNRKRDREYKASRRQKMHEHVITLDAKEHERVAQGAKERKTSVPYFIKHISLAYLDQVYVPDMHGVKKIEALLIRSLTAIERISARDAKKGWFGKDNDYEELRKIITDMRTQVHMELFSPALLHRVVLNNPSQWPELLKIMGYDNKDIGGKGEQ